ncbi:amidase [Pseudooceanicola onchidii]|uniref:amidase n=1 Tax=Pseudooceanicola onchidii TaxID=2562279 RepID=UPI0010AB46F8|nr:amidase [Pseudooceanicola onchidii]
MTLIDLDATALVAQMETGAVTSEEVMTACLDRIEAVNGQVNAIVALRDRDTLLAEARAADATPRKGWLHGLPIAVKDLANTMGIPSTMGSPVLKDFVPKRDDLFVARMRAAGAIFIGKTNAPEFGLGSHTVNPVYGPTRNPYDTALSAGGSSGGAGVALAAGMQWVCDGSDMMGSLRNPAGWNNVYGFRPSFGLVPGDVDRDFYLHPLATSGPMGKSPADMAALLDIQSGADPRIPLSFDGPQFAGNLQAEVAGKRVGWLGDWGGAWPMEAGVKETCEAALSTFADLGVEVVQTDAPFPAQDLWQAWIDLRSFAVAASCAPIYDNPTHRPHLREDAVWELERGRALTPVQIQKASAIRSAWFRRAGELFADVDALIAPTAQVWPFPIDWMHPKEIAGRRMDTYHRWMECVIPASIIGLPAAAVPAGFGDAGLPMGLQIIGPYKRDLSVLQIAQAWHEATDWPARRPALRG